VAALLYLCIRAFLCPACVRTFLFEKLSNSLLVLNFGVRLQYCNSYLKNFPCRVDVREVHSSAQYCFFFVADFQGNGERRRRKTRTSRLTALHSSGFCKGEDGGANIGSAKGDESGVIDEVRTRTRQKCTFAPSW